MSLLILSFILNLLKIFIITCILLLRITYCWTKPTSSRVDMYSDKVQNYLMEFGYLPKSDVETGNLRTEEQLKEAIKTLQRFGNIPATGLIDELTRALIKRPRCGQPDNPYTADFSATNRLRSDIGNKRLKRYVIQGPKWPTTSVTWSLVNQTMENLDAGQVRRVLSDALDVWSSGSRLTFQEVYSENADIQVLFAKRFHGDGYDFDGPGSVLAHAFYPGTGRGGDAHFDEEENWIISSNEGDGTNLMGVAVHEFGHSLGLGHSSVENAIMFPWYHGYQMYKELPEDDRLAIQQIYGAREKQWGYNPQRRLKPSEQPNTTETTTKKTTTTPKSYYPDQRHNEIEERKRQRSREKEERERERKRNRERTHYSTQSVLKYNPDEITPRIYTERPDYEYPTGKSTFDNPRKSNKQPNYPRVNSDKGSTTTIKTTTKRSRFHQNHHHYNFNNNSNQPKREKPETCNTSYDAITILRGELFIFKNRFLWRIGDNGLYAGYPHEITRVWDKLPINFTHIDAVYENKDRKIVFFIGKKYYVFNSNVLEKGYPKPLSHLGLPEALDKIDAVLVWGHNNRTYFYSGTMYWRFDEDVHHVELDYPRDMSIWRGIGYHIDAAFQYKDGKTYFFKGKSFWQFNDSIMHVARNRPESSASRWMGCPRATETYSNEVYEDEPRHKQTVTASATKKWHNTNLALCLFLLVWLRLKPLSFML